MQRENLSIEFQINIIALGMTTTIKAVMLVTIIAHLDIILTLLVGIVTYAARAPMPMDMATHIAASALIIAGAIVDQALVLVIAVIRRQAKGLV